MVDEYIFKKIVLLVLIVKYWHKIEYSALNNNKKVY